jgi:2,4-dienoyl-CoA reductase-like NADH-dependent reductase (Old Yellow Enzyme family)
MGTVRRNEYAHVLSPLAVGPVRLRNRVAVTSHQTGLVHDHLPTDDLVAYHQARAEGGAGILFIEATAVHESGLLTAHTLGGYLPGIVAGYQRLAGPVHDAGGAMFVQLFHGGREQISSSPMTTARGCASCGRRSPRCGRARVTAWR